jgi:hypothetical protein
MKKINVTLIVLFLATSLFASELKETRSLDPFYKIVATNGVNVLLREGNEEKAEIRVSNGLLSDVITTVSKGALKVKMKPRINKDLSVVVIITFQSLELIDAKSGSNIETKDVILQDKISIKATSGGRIKAELEGNEITVSAGQGADITLYGWAKRLDVSANTKGKIKAQEMKSEKVFAKANTGGEITVAPNEYLEAVATTAGVIKYTRKPKKQTVKASSGGEVKEAIKRHGDDLIKDIED